MIHWDRILAHFIHLIVYILIGAFPGLIMGILSAYIIYIEFTPHYFRWEIVIICITLFSLYSLSFGIKDITRDYL